MIEDHARSLMRLVRPVGIARCHKIGLAAQDHTVVEHLQAVGGKRRTGRRDIDDHLRSADRWRAFSRAGALDDAVVDDAMGSKECPGEVDVFGGHPHPPVMLRAEAGDVVEIGHGPDIDPGLRYRYHDVGAAKAEASIKRTRLSASAMLLAHEILAGDAEMDRAARQLRGDSLAER